MRAAAAVGIDDDLAARKPGVPVRAADHELARRIDVQDIVVADQPGQLVAGALQTRLDARNEDRAHVLADRGLHPLLGLLLRQPVARQDEFVVLGRNHDGMHAQRTVGLLVVLDGHLRLGIGTQVGHHLPFAADDGQLLEDHVREDQRRRHHLAGLVAGIAEHDALIARTLLVLLGAHDALIDVRRLFVDGRQDAARVAVELVFALGIADAVDHTARHALYIDIRFGAHLARHDHQSRGAKRLAGDFRVGVTTQEFVENGVRNLI